MTRTRRADASLWRFGGPAVLLLLIYNVYQHMRSGPDARYPYQGTPWHQALLSLDASVSWFFALSGFVLGLPYAKAVVHGTTPTPARTLLFERTVRVVPLYVVSILVVWTLRNQTFPGDWRDLFEHLTFTHVFDDKRIFFTIGPAWALAVQVQFTLLLVLLWPLVWTRWLHARTDVQRRRLSLAAVGALAACSVAWKLIAHLVLDVGEGRWWVWFGLPAKLDIFAAGLLVAAMVAHMGDREPRPRTAMWCGVSGVGVVVAAVVMRSSFVLPVHVYFHTLCAAGFGLLMAAWVLSKPAPAEQASASASARPNTPSAGFALGIISYSLFLWHEPIMILLADHGLFPDPGSPHAFVFGMLILTPVAGLAAWASYWVIEYPTGMIGRTRGQAGRSRNYYSAREFDDELISD